MLGITTGGNTNRLDSFLASILKGDLYRRANLDAIAQQGVAALQAATPRDSGATADGWYYEIEIKGSLLTIYWCNRNVIDGFPVAVGLQYGHGTGTGGWVEGYDYINPALKRIFDQIADAVWKEVTRA